MTNANPARTEVPAFRGRRSRAILLTVLAACAAILMATPAGTAALAGVGRWLVVRSPERPADLIVALGGDRARQETAAALLRRGAGAWILFVGPDARQRDCECVGLPAARCLPVAPDPAWTTGGEASEVAAVVRARGFRSVLVVTTDYHSRRARWVFRRALRGTGADVRIALSPNRAFPVERWWRHHAGIKAVATEYAGMLWYEANFLLGRRT